MTPTRNEGASGSSNLTKCGKTIKPKKLHSRSEYVRVPVHISGREEGEDQGFICCAMFTSCVD